MSDLAIGSSNPPGSNLDPACPLLQEIAASRCSPRNDHTK
jgi:hypothetical protein